MAFEVCWDDERLWSCRLGVGFGITVGIIPPIDEPQRREEFRKSSPETP